MLRAVLFDMDGVIMDTMGRHAAAWMKAAGELGLEIDELEIYRREGEKGEISARDFIKAAGMMTTKKRVAEFLGLKERLFSSWPAAKPFSGALEIAAYVRDMEIRTALVTGSSRSEALAILPSKAHNLFDAFVFGDEVLHGKPNPEPYLKAMLALNVKPQESLVVENAPFGIQSGKSAGALVVAVKSYLPAEDLAHADHIIDDIRQLPEFLKQLKGN